MTLLSGAKWRAGFAHHRSAFAYNIRIPCAQQIMGVSRKVHTAEHLASAVFALGVPIGEVPRAQLFLSAAEELPPLGRYAVLHPFASSPEKTWPADRFCEVARYLKLWNIEPVFLAGPNDDPSAFRAHQVVRGSLSRVKALLSKAVVFIGNDSGPAHMAAAFSIPSIVMFSTSNPVIWGPWRTESEIIVSQDGLEKISVSRIITALERLRMPEKAHA
jgi:ADP-heptose:LPS heptosyltransferase